MTENKISWVEKYRPSNINDVIDHEENLLILNTFVKTKKSKNVMFYGPPGTGKTTTALAYAKKLYGPNYKNMIIEQNGSDDRGIDEIRNNVFSCASAQQIDDSISSIKLIILDECDNMTENAQYALKSVIQATERNARFCLICNYETKIINDLKSLCTPLLFSPISKDKQYNLIKHIAAIENVNIDNDAIKLIIKLSKGDMRKSINLLEQLSTSNQNEITKDMIYYLIGGLNLNDKATLRNLILDKTITLKDAILGTLEIKTLNGFTTKDIMNELLEFLPPSIELYDSLAEIEEYQNKDYNEELFIANLIARVKNII